MADYPEKIQELLDDLEFAGDRAMRMAMLAEIGDRFEEVPESVAARPFPPESQAKHCESLAYAFAAPNGDGTLKLHFAVENPQGLSAKAFAVILDEALSNRPVDEILNLSSDVIYDIFGKELSMGKGMGLTGLLQVVKGLAKSHAESAA